MTNDTILTPILIPTEDASIIQKGGEKLFLATMPKKTGDGFEANNLYLYSTILPKKGDWCLWLIQHEYKLVKAEYDNPLLHFKIARATDPKLIADGVLPIDGNTKAFVTLSKDAQVEGMSKQIKVNFLEEYCKWYNFHLVNNEIGKIPAYDTGLTAEETKKGVDVEKLAMDNKELKSKWSHLYAFGYPKKPYPTNYENDLNMVMLGYYQAQALQSNVGGYVSDKELEQMLNKLLCKDIGEGISRIKSLRQGLNAMRERMSNAGGYSLEFIRWYSGMKEEAIVKAWDRWKRESEEQPKGGM